MEIISQEEAKIRIKRWQTEGISIDLIKEKLAEHGFVSVVIESLLEETGLIIPIPPPPPEIIPPALTPDEMTLLIDSNTSHEQVTNRRPKLISFLLFLSFGNFISTMLLTLLLISVISISQNEGHILKSFFSIVPLFCIYPSFLSTIATFVLYLFIKTKDLSLKSYKLLFYSNIIIPILHSSFVYLMLSQLDATRKITNNQLNSGDSIFSTIFSASLLSSIFISILILLRIKKNKNLFNNSSKSLNLKQKIFFFITSFLFIIPAFGTTLLVIKNIYKPDTKFIEIQTQVGHKLYVPSYLPEGVEMSSQYFISNKQKTQPYPIVMVHFDNSTLDESKTLNPRQILMTQTLAPENFDLLYLFDTDPLKTNIEKVEISTALNNIGYITTQTDQNNQKIKGIDFITTDNIMISFSSTDSINNQELLDMANSIK